MPLCDRKSCLRKYLCKVQSHSPEWRKRGSESDINYPAVAPVKTVPGAFDCRIMLRRHAIYRTHDVIYVNHGSLLTRSSDGGTRPTRSKTVSE